MVFMVLFIIGVLAVGVGAAYLTCDIDKKGYYKYKKLMATVFIVGAVVAIISAICGCFLCSKVPYKELAKFESERQNIQVMVDGIDFNTCSNEVLDEIAKDVAKFDNAAEWYENHRNGSLALYLTKTPKDTSPIKIENERLKEAVQKIKDTN